MNNEYDSLILNIQNSAMVSILMRDLILINSNNWALNHRENVPRKVQA